MTRRGRLVATILFIPALSSIALAQDLGPNFRKLKEGIFVQSAREVNSTVGIVLTSEGVVLIDTGQTLVDTRQVAETVKKLTPLPVRFVINTEVHADHTTGNFVFSPPAVVINHAGAGDAMRKANNPDRFAKADPEIKAAAEGYRLVTPHVEYQDNTTLRVGERTFELLLVLNAHSEADTAVWLPQERVLFAGSAAIPNSLNNVRPFVTITDLVAAARMLKSLNPEVVVPGHGSPGTTTIFDESEKYYSLLLERVTAMVKAGKTREQIDRKST